MSKKFFKSFQARQNGVEPGPCLPEGCPPPTEIVCIKTKKVYQECKQLETDEDGKAFEVELKNIKVPDGAVTVECVRIDPSFKSCDMCNPGKECCCEILPPDQVKFNFPKKIEFSITVEFFDSSGNSLGFGTGKAKLDKLPKSKIVRLSRAGEPRMQCEVDMFFDCLLCFLVPDETPKVHCCINVLLVFKLFAEVQLMVPAYGFCPQPPECQDQVAGECPPAVQTWPPYPLQE
ncbi:MAG: hypothetical protein H0Z35_06635 [Thermoanaerobacteraceae bacterium]|nr:hypothetical protein [Thermoanaerobacteraceae bacterium]